jgi:DNA helicase-2/ATP-dependent DNA helicase PcrA
MLSTLRRQVFVLNAVDGCILSDLATGSTAEVGEERRLLYVAMTRAQDHVHLVVPQRFYVYGQRSGCDGHVYASRMRFVPDSILDRFGRCAWAVTGQPAGAAATNVGLRAKCDARVNVRIERSGLNGTRFFGRV